MLTTTLEFNYFVGNIMDLQGNIEKQKKIIQHTFNFNLN